MRKRKHETYIQYSKRMCTYVSIFWMIYRVVNFVVALIRPEITEALVNLTAGVDTIMITNMSAYLLNSSTEKVAIAFGKRGLYYSSSNNVDDDEEDDDESNG